MDSFFRLKIVEGGLELCADPHTLKRLMFRHQCNSLSHYWPNISTWHKTQNKFYWTF